MKKILFAALVAVVCMACNQNGADVPSSDKKAVDAAAVGLADVLGKEEKAVDKVLLNAGYTKINTSEASIAPKKAPKRLFPAKADEERRSVIYVYDLPDDLNIKDAAAVEAWQVKQLKAGKFVIIAAAMFDNTGAFRMSEVEVVTTAKDKINLLYTEVSDKLYAKLPSKPGNPLPYVEWSASAHTESIEADYYDHADFVTAVAAAQIVKVAQERGTVITSMEYEGLVYGTRWNNDGEVNSAIGAAIVEGTFGVADPKAAMGGMPEK